MIGTRCVIMVAHQEGDHAFEPAVERIHHYWKKAAQSYHQACTSESEVGREIYFRAAMAWAAMANELELQHDIPEADRLEIRTAY